MDDKDLIARSTNDMLTASVLEISLSGIDWVAFGLILNGTGASIAEVVTSES